MSDSEENDVANDQHTHEQKSTAPAQAAAQEPQAVAQPDTADALPEKKPEELSPDELRLMADTMPGDGPGD
jgi:hypothetical protein